MKKDFVSHLFIGIALVSLVAALAIGCVAAVQYLYPSFLKEQLAIYKIRPIHVTLDLSWIVLSIFGGIYYYLPRICGAQLHSKGLSRVHVFLFAATGIAIIFALLLGVLGGREYMAFSPILSIPVLIGWAMFGFNYFRTLYKRLEKWPVFLWMWATGIVFFLFTFTEAHLWLIPYFRNSLVRDLTVQWKSYGSMVGSLNMLIYGTALFLMYSITKEEKLAYGAKSFALYFLGFANLLYGWGHHTYIIPADPWIRTIAYAISMTELIILGNIIWHWRKTVSSSLKYSDLLPARFLFSADLWVVLILVLALLISVPAFQILTHGTRITVAHAMGTTIGINSTILLASVFYILSQKYSGVLERFCGLINKGIYVFHISLFAFCAFLVMSGIERSGWMNYDTTVTFSALQLSLRQYLIGFLISGIGLAVGVLMIVSPALRCLYCFFMGHEEVETELSDLDLLKAGSV